MKKMVILDMEDLEILMEILDDFSTILKENEAFKRENQELRALLKTQIVKLEPIKENVENLVEFLTSIIKEEK